MSVSTSQISLSDKLLMQPTKSVMQTNANKSNINTGWPLSRNSKIRWHFHNGLQHSYPCCGHLCHAHVIISIVGAVTKYCNEHTICVSVCPWAYLPNHTHDLYQMFRKCCLLPWLGPPLAGWRKPSKMGNFGGFLPNDNALYGPYSGMNFTT